MRESIGGAFLINIMVVFLILYNSLLAIAVNYAIAFRVKNHIIDLLEQYEGCANVDDRVRTYVQTVGYYRANSPTGRGYEITPIPDSRGTYYTVTTHITFDFPWVSQITIPITGQTKVVYGVQETETQCNGI